MTESFLRDADIVPQPEMDLSKFVDDPDYVPDFGLVSRNLTGKPIQTSRIIVKQTAFDKPYSNAELAKIAKDLFGVSKTVVEKTEYVQFLTHEKNLAVIQRDNELRRLALKRQNLEAGTDEDPS